MSYAHILGTMYELCSYYDNGFIIDKLRYIISSMTFIMTPITVSSVDIKKVPKSLYVSFRCRSKFDQMNWNHQIDCYHVYETVKVDDM